MKIAVCDDSLNDMRYLEQLIRSSKLCPDNVCFYEYASGGELLNNFMEFDAIFLDIQMTGMDGRTAAEQIRKYDPEVVLSFYSGFEISARRVLKSHPFIYLMKGSDKQELCSEIDIVLSEVLRKKEVPRVPVTCDGKMYVLSTSEILYISILSKGTGILVTEPKAREVWGEKFKTTEQMLKSATRIEDYYERLKYFGFLYASKSYIINAEHVVARFPNSVQLRNGEELSVSRSRKREFDAGFSQYWGTKYNRERKKG